MPHYTDLALGAGAVLAVGLGVFALRPAELPDREPDGGSASPSVSVSATPEAKKKDPKPTTSATSATSTDATAWVVGAADGLVLRAPLRDCEAEGPTVIGAIGPRGGLRDTEVEGLRAVGGFRVDDADNAVLVGVDGDCERVGFGTTDAGKSWKPLGDVPAIWSLVPGDDAEVHAPSGQVEVPCEPLSVTGLDDSVARLACTDGRVLGTVDGGDAWSILGNNDDMLGVGFVSPTTAVGLVASDDCEGIEVVRSTDGGTDFASAYCVEGAGPWGLVAWRGHAVVAGADRVARSDDDGDTWESTPLAR